MADVRPLEISLIDRSSTGHTFVNELKTPGNGVPVKLQDGDFFTCGIDPLRYTVCRVLEELKTVIPISKRLNVSAKTLPKHFVASSHWSTLAA